MGLSRLTVALLASVAAVAQGWWCTGHMLTANVAFRTIKSSTMDAVKPLIQSLVDEYPMTGPSFIESACWADDLKTMGVNQYDSYHFIDLPVIQPPVFFQVPAVDNITCNPWAIEQAVNTLSTPDAAVQDKARQLRFLIHFVGDLHQPLHAATLYNSMFLPPLGDMGGNLYKIAGDAIPSPDITELHALWDSGGGQWVNDPVRPLNQSDRDSLDSITTTIMSLDPINNYTPLLSDPNPWNWAIESNGIAWNWCYTAPMAPEPIPESYVETSQTVAQSRIALGGYRLASLLDTIFGSNMTTTTTMTKGASRGRSSSHAIRGTGHHSTHSSASSDFSAFKSHNSINTLAGAHKATVRRDMEMKQRSNAAKIA